MRAAVVGHVEWIEFARVPHVPTPGEIVHAEEVWEEPGGGGAVAAVQLARLAGGAIFFTALSDDPLGRRARAELGAIGVRVEAASRDEPQRRAFVHVDHGGERTITVNGERMGPSGADPLPWDELQRIDAAYFTAGDRDAVRAARKARALVASARGLPTLVDAGVELDALVSSASDAGERYSGELDPPPRVVVRTAGAGGGEWETADGRRGRYEAAELPGPVTDAYGAGDCFAAGFTWGLGSGLPLEEALAQGARCGAAAIAGKGAYG